MKNVIIFKRMDNGDYSINVNNFLYSQLGGVDGVVFEVLYLLIANNILQYLVVNRSFYISSGRDELLCNKNSSISQNMKCFFDFSQVQVELASNLLNIFPESKKGDFFDIASNIGRDILKGVIDVEYRNGNTYFFFKNKEQNIILPFDRVSSAIKELSPFILYLKYFLKKGDTLIIEEPEAHLHPINQRKLVKYFVESINNGLNIIITTHSDYIRDQINNNIRLGYIPNNILKEEFKEYDKNHVLDFKKIHLYIYKQNDLFSFETSELDINSTGFSEDNFANVSHDLYDETIKIINLKEV